MPRSGPALDDLESAPPAIAAALATPDPVGAAATVPDSAAQRRAGLNDWPEPPWRYQVGAIVVILLGLGAMTLAAR